MVDLIWLSTRSLSLSLSKAITIIIGRFISLLIKVSVARAIIMGIN